MALLIASSSLDVPLDPETYKERHGIEGDGDDRHEKHALRQTQICSLCFLGPFEVMLHPAIQVNHFSSLGLSADAF
jgi:hypothetical protein